MEAQNNINIHHENDGGSNSNMKPPPSFLCRQSSTRWTPTTDQIKILRELYYSNGIRSPSADQIQRISARLRQYGKIEGKNVFYWFQNHKARERQKKRFTTTSSTTNNNNELLINNHMNMNMSIPSAASAFHRNNNTVNPGHWRSSEDHSSVTYNSNYASPTYITPPPGFAAIGQIGSHCYGSVAMEQSFRECSISPNDYHHHHHSNGAPMNQHIINSSSVPTPYPFLDKLNSSYDHETLDEDEDDDDDDYHQAVREIETLPLFPMHGEDHYGSSSTAFNCNNYKAAESSNGHNYYAGGWYQSDHIGASRASLELSLNSYGSRSTNQFY